MSGEDTACLFETPPQRMEKTLEMPGIAAVITMLLSFEERHMRDIYRQAVRRGQKHAAERFTHAQRMPMSRTLRRSGHAVC